MPKPNDEEWRRKYDAPEGAIWICGACGKKHKNRTRVGDESCFVNAVLIVDAPPIPTEHGPEYQPWEEHETEKEGN